MLPGGLSFFNTSKMDLGTLSESGIKANLDSNVSSFSKDAREIFEYFNFAEFIGQLNDAMSDPTIELQKQHFNFSKPSAYAASIPEIG